MGGLFPDSAVSLCSQELPSSTRREDKCMYLGLGTFCFGKHQLRRSAFLSTFPRDRSWSDTPPESTSQQSLHVPKPHSPRHAEVVLAETTLRHPTPTPQARARRPALRSSLTRPAQWRRWGRARAGRGLGRRAPEPVASMRPPCPWREAEVAELRPEAPGLRDRDDVGFFSPGHCPGCEQEEAAAHPGRPHPGEWPERAVGRMTLVHLRPREEVTAAGRRARSVAAASRPAFLVRAGEINKPGRGCSAGAGRPGNYVSQQAVGGCMRGRGVVGGGGGGPLRARGRDCAWVAGLSELGVREAGGGNRDPCPRGARGGRKLAGERRSERGLNKAHRSLRSRL